MLLNDSPVNISIIGVGDAGCKAVKIVSENNLKNVNCLYANSDKKSLENYDANSSIFLNDNANGLGNSGDPLIGKMAALSSLELIKDKLKSTNVLILTAGFGGGTGTGALPIIAKTSKDMDILTIAVVTTPFSYEGVTKDLNARIGLKELKENVDIVITVSNNRIINNYPDIIVTDVFKLINKVLKNTINYFIDIFSNNFINVSKNDLLKYLRNKGDAYIGFGSGVGRNKVIRAVNGALNSKLIESSFEKSTNAIMMIVGDPTITTHQINEVIKMIRSKAKNNNSLDIVFSYNVDEKLVNEMRISIISTLNKKNDDEDKIQKSQELLIEIGNTLENELNGYTTGELDLSSSFDFDVDKINNQFDDKDQEGQIITSDESKDDDDIPFFLK